MYKLSADEADIKAAAYTTFCRLWRQLVPQIMVMKPMSDLCWVCQQHSRAIMRSANTPEEEKTQVTRTYLHTEDGWHTLAYSCRQVLKDAEAHLHLATQERSYYRSVIDTSKEALKDTFTVNGELQVPPICACLPPATKNITMHFSFDMAQQVCY